MKPITSKARRTALSALAALTALPVLAVARPAAAASDNTKGTPTVSNDAWTAGRAKHGRKATSAQAVEAYWTPERMRKATPIEDSPAYQEAVEKYAQSVEQAKANAQASPNRQAAPAGTPRTVAPKQGTVKVASGPSINALDPGYNYWHPTARTSGKVFFSMGGSNFVCSGTVVNSEGQDTVWTAGHCLHGGRGRTWATNWQFVPAYDDDLADPRPYGTWTAAQLWSKSAWTANSDFSADMGVAIMNTRNGYHIVSYLGGQGFRVNAGRRVYEYAFGYPSESPYDGGNLRRCNGTSSPEWEVLWWWSETIKISCDMTRGSSGGGWLNGWDGNYGYLNGVNSRIDRIVGPTIMLSPYFDDTAWSLYNSTRYL